MSKIKKYRFVKYEILTSLSKINLKQLHEVHIKNLPNDIFPKFGLEFMSKYFEHLIEYNKGKILIARINKKIVGFIVLKFKKNNISKFLNIKSILKFLIFFIWEYKVIARLVYQLIDAVKSPKYSYEIEFFVVSEKYRSKGIGKKLIKKCEKIGLKNKFQKIWTKTHNQKLVNYYINKKDAKIFKNYKILDYNYYCVYWKLN